MKAVSEGLVDYVSLGKQSIADPEWPNKVKAGRFEDIRSCIGCNDCLLGILRGRLVQCAVNPRVGYENFTQLKPATNNKRVLVIGGGIGGMQSAITAAQRGHSVTIWEKETRLGGLGIAAGAPSVKQSVRNYVAYLETQVRKNSEKITVTVNKCADLESVKKFNPDEIIVSTGSKPIDLPVEGMKDNDKVGAATEYLLGTYEPKGDIVIIGAGLIGCESALQLAMDGHTVTVVEMLGKIVAKDDINANNEMKLAQLLADNKVQFFFTAKAKKLDSKGLTIELEGKEKLIPCDTVLVAAGMKSDDKLAELLFDHFDNVHVIGDANKPGRIMEAVHQGYAVSNNMI